MFIYTLRIATIVLPFLLGAVAAPPSRAGAGFWRSATSAVPSVNSWPLGKVLAVRLQDLESDCHNKGDDPTRNIVDHPALVRPDKEKQVDYVVLITTKPLPNSRSHPLDMIDSSLELKGHLILRWCKIVRYTPGMDKGRIAERSLASPETMQKIADLIRNAGGRRPSDPSTIQQQSLTPPLGSLRQQSATSSDKPSGLSSPKKPTRDLSGPWRRL